MISRDWTTLTVSVLLSITSLVVIFSIAPNRLPQQATYIFIGFLLYLYLSRQDTALLSNLAPSIYILSILALIAVFIFGADIRGSSRWIEVFNIQFQISEFTKPLLIVAFAEFISKWKPDSLGNIFKNFVLFIVPTVLIFIEPDLGTALVYLVFWFTMLFIGGLNKLAIISAVLLATLLIVLSPYYLQDYQLERLQTFTNPYNDPLGSGYNVIQSMIAIGSGEYFGRGLGKGTQSHLQFLPEKHTDFIFASLAEEFGFFGSIAVIILYIILLTHLLNSALLIRSKRERLIVLAVFAYIFFQAFLNIGMNLGIAPVTGVTLPLLSSGGSSVLATFISLALASSIISKIKSRASIEIR